MRYKLIEKATTTVNGACVRSGEIVEVEDTSSLPRFPEWWEEVEVQASPVADDTEEDW